MYSKQEAREEFPYSLYWNIKLRPIIRWGFRQCLVLGWIWPFIFLGGAVLFTNFSGLDPLLWRSFSNTDQLMIYMHNLMGWNDYSNHHFLNLIIEGGAVVGLAVYSARVTKKSIVQFGLLASYGGVLIWSIHEGLWWIVYIVNYWPLNLMLFTGVGELFTIGLLWLTPALRLYAPKNYLVAMIAFYVFWYFQGFPITQAYFGNTSLYSTDYANAWEIGSWAYAVITFFLLERKGLLRWYQDKIKLCVKYSA